MPQILSRKGCCAKYPDIFGNYTQLFLLIVFLNLGNTETRFVYEPRFKPEPGPKFDLRPNKQARKSPKV